MVLQLGNEFSVDADSSGNATLGLTEIIFHPEYDESGAGGLSYDVALIKLSGSADARFHWPACLPSQDADYTGDMGWMYVWGESSMVPLVEDDICSQAGNSDDEDFYAEDMICAGGASGAEVCSVEHGSPLTVEVDGRNIVTGVSSWTLGCGGDGRQYAVYSELAKVRTWIEESMAAAGGAAPCNSTSGWNSTATWGSWGAWSSCSENCDRSRERDCLFEDGMVAPSSLCDGCRQDDISCSSGSIEYEDCEDGLCGGSTTEGTTTEACTGSACTSILNRRSLEEYNNAICNDGSTAVYYVDEEAHRDGQSVMVYLEGGGACYTDQTCSDRCEGAEAEYLCEAQTDPVKDFNEHVWSKDPTTNPGLHDSLKVYVPYCTSDGYSGRRPASSESGGYAFFGKAVVEGLVEDLLEKVIGSNSIRQFTLMGVSAGAFGVAFNCDAVAAKVKAKDPNADVRCIMDSHDFIPTDVSEGCNPLEWGSLAKTYWQGEFDQSCEQANGADSTQCNVFTTYYQQITTPFMVIVPLEEVDPGVHPCTPEWPEDSNFWSRWREALHTAAQQLAQDMPNSGMFMSNCAHHVTLANPTTWSAMPVPTIDSNNQASVTLNQVLSNWLKDTRPFQALDGPTIRNPSCPYDD